MNDGGLGELSIHESLAKRIGKLGCVGAVALDAAFGDCGTFGGIPLGVAVSADSSASADFSISAAFFRSLFCLVRLGAEMSAYKDAS